MQEFTFYTPTKLVFGKNTECEIGKLIKEENAKKVLIHFGGQSARKSGLLDRVETSLKKADIDFVLLGGVVPNPRLSKVYEGIEICNKENVDFILAVGGGSVIDSAKGIAYGVANKDNDVWDFYAGKAKAQSALPTGAILTIAAAGSEMSNSSVITNEDGWLKRGYSDDLSRCRFAIMNPELTLTLPLYQTISGCVDIWAHAMERYFTKDKNAQLRDELTEALFRTVIDNTRILYKNPDDYNARAEVMWAGTLAHNDVLGVRMIGDWATHQLEHELSGMFDVAHGAGLAAMWGSWARYVYKEDLNRFVRYAVNVMGVTQDFDNPEKTALLGIEAMEKFFKEVDMPISIKELVNEDLTDKQIDELSYKCSFEEKRTIGTFKGLNKTDMKKIYEMAR